MFDIRQKTHILIRMNYYTIGNLIDIARSGSVGAITHGCNCQCVMGAGVALAIAKAFPEALVADKNTLSGRGKMGSYSVGLTMLENGDLLKVFNSYTQINPGSGSFSYKALQDAFRSILNNLVAKRQISLAFPAIGGGLAGADFSMCYDVIVNQFNIRNQRNASFGREVDSLFVIRPSERDQFESIAKSRGATLWQN